MWTQGFLVMLASCRLYVMEPIMEHGTVEMVSVEWIMKNVDGSVDGYDTTQGVNYQRMVSYKGSDSSFGPLVGAIFDQGFRVPIVLCLNYRGKNITLGNGHHRMVAAILMCIDQIPVYWSDCEVYKDYMCVDHSTDETCNPWTLYPHWKDLSEMVGEVVDW